ncbi:MAG: TlpA disulfide reductase family protein [Planctomycetota bacterium]|nr:TlpA disulfide reductase family protein [Planctomycetota bacterium]
MKATLCASSCLAVVVFASTSLFADTVPLVPIVPVSAPTQTAPAAATDDIDQRMKSLREFAQSITGDAAGRASYQVKLAELAVGLDPTAMSFDQLRRAWPLVNGSETLQPAARARLIDLSSADTVEGIEVLIFAGRGQVVPSETIAATVVARNAFSAWREKFGLPALLSLLAGADDATLSANSALVMQVSSDVASSTDWKVVRSSKAALALVSRLGDKVTTEQIETLRATMSASATNCAVALESAGSAADAKRLRRVARLLNGAAATGKLVGYPSPALAFEWVGETTGEVPAWKSITDLKGKVVVIDFWATWCGPCVASFPHVKELRAHYPTDQLAIIGVTSLQGKHHPGGGKPAVPTDGDAAKEYALMKEFMVEKDIDWTIAFSSDDVFNPDFDVNGIPHVAIIDTKGVVRFNNLHPSDPFIEKADKIDALLREAGVEPPARPAPATDAPPSSGG